MPKDETKAKSKYFISKLRETRNNGLSKTDEKLADLTGLQQQALDGMIRSVARAFDEAGLDPSREADWHTLAIVLAAALYGGKRPGHPKVWTKTALSALVAAVVNKQLEKPNLSDSRSCEFLVKPGGPYPNMNPKTLRRVLVRARRATT